MEEGEGERSLDKCVTDGETEGEHGGEIVRGEGESQGGESATK